MIVLSGKVLDESGNALPNAQVVAESLLSGITEKISVKTDSNGSYKMDVEVGSWQLSATLDGYVSAAPLRGHFSADATGQNFRLEKGTKLTVKVVWKDTQDGQKVADAEVYVDSLSNTIVEKGRSDPNGICTFYLPKARWRIFARHEQGSPAESFVTLAGTPGHPKDITIGISQSRLNHDGKAGRSFFGWLTSTFLVLAVLYTVLHTVARPLPTPYAITARLDQVENVLERNSVPSSSAEVQRALRDLRVVLDEALNQATSLSSVDRSDVATQLEALRSSVAGGRIDEAQTRIAELRVLSRAYLQTVPLFWQGTAGRYFEILFWALAGVLVLKILDVGTYLYLGRYHKEGFHMHIANLVTAPVIVFITVLLLSFASLTLGLGENTVKLDLTNTGMLVVVAFVLGAQPWTVWRSLRSYADQLVKSRQSETATTETN